jgi:hypothetical protein
MSDYRTVGQLLTGTGATTIYTCPSFHKAEISLFQVNNLHSGTVDLTAKAVLSSTDIPIVTTYSMAADEVMDVLNSNPISLNSADTIVVTAGAASKLNVVVTAKEVYTG